MNTTNMNDSGEKSNYGMSLKDLFTLFWKWKWLFAIVIASFTLVFSIIGYISSQNSGKVIAVVEFQWDGINLGEYPDGQRFDYNSMIDGPVLSESIADANLDLSSIELRKYLKITPVVPNDLDQIIERAKLQDINFTYFPSTFQLSIDVGLLGINKDTGKTLISLIVDRIRENFEEKYIEKTLILNYTADEISELDYIESLEVLKTQVELINSAISNQMPEASDFVSTKYNQGFNDIIVRLNLINDIFLSNMESRINNYLLSKDHDLLITRYSYLIELLNLDLDKELKLATEVTQLIDTYKGNTSTIIIPGMDVANQIPTEPYLNDLYQNLVNIQLSIATIERDIDYYEIRVQRLRGEDPSFILTPEKIETETAFVVSMISSISSDINSITQVTDDMISEYVRLVTRGSIRLITPVYFDNTSFVLFVAVGFILGTISGVVSVFIFDNRKKNKLQNL